MMRRIIIKMDHTGEIEPDMTTNWVTFADAYAIAISIDKMANARTGNPQRDILVIRSSCGLRDILVTRSSVDFMQTS